MKVLKTVFAVLCAAFFAFAFSSCSSNEEEPVSLEIPLTSFKSSNWTNAYNWYTETIPGKLEVIVHKISDEEDADKDESREQDKTYTYGGTQADIDAYNTYLFTRQNQEYVTYKSLFDKNIKLEGEYEVGEVVTLTVNLYAYYIDATGGSISWHNVISASSKEKALKEGVNPFTLIIKQNSQG